MDPVKSEKIKEKEGAKGYEDQDTRIQGLENSVTTMTAVIQKGMDESDARFEKMFKELTAHKSGTAHLLRECEIAASVDQEKAEQERKDTAAAILTELTLMKQDARAACTAATTVNIKTEDESPSPERVTSDPIGLNPETKPKRLFPFASIDKPMSTSSKWKLEMVPYQNGKELSTHLMTVKITGDIIQDMKTSHGQVSILFFVATNGLVVLPDFDSLHESFSYRK